MTKNKITEIADKIKKYLKEDNIVKLDLFLSEILKDYKTPKMKITSTPLLYKIGVILQTKFKKDEIPYDVIKKWWVKSYNEKKTYAYGVMTGRETRQIIIAMLSRVVEQDPDAVLKFIIKISESMEDWETVDSLCSRVIIKLFQKNQELMLNIFEDWLLSNNQWTRRLPVATLPYLIRKNPQYSEIAFRILDIVMYDRSKAVKKAAAWAMREISKIYPKKIENYVEKWKNKANKETLWIIKNGTKKLDVEKRKKLIKSITV